MSLLEDYLKINEVAYDSSAEHYEKKAQQMHIKKLSEEVAYPFVTEIKNRFSSPQNVLEIGPGAGLMLSLFEKEGFDITAIDISKKLLDLSRNKCNGGEYIHANFLDYEFFKDYFEGIFARAVIHTFPKRDGIKFLKKIESILVAGGIAHVCTDINIPSSEGYFKKRGIEEVRFRKFWEEEELLNEINNTSLKIFKKEYYPSAEERRGITLLLEKPF